VRIFRKISGVSAVCTCAIILSCNVAGAQTSANFNGFFVSIDGGAVTNSAYWTPGDWHFMAAPGFFDVEPVNIGGFAGYFGPNVGYSQQILQTGLGALVAGGVADFNFLTIPGTRTDCFHDLFECWTNTSDLFTARAILGLVPPGSSIMPYVTGGLAGANVFNQKFGTPFIAPMHFTGLMELEDGVTKFQLGWTAGAGIEYQLLPPGTLGWAPGALSAQGEILVTGLPSESVTRGLGVSENLTELKFGVTYRLAPLPFLLHY
jgi:opacity protein-like surface antigen